MKKTKLTRSLLAACSIVALSVVLSGCLHSSGDGPAYSELDLTGYDTADGATVEADTYSTDGLPSALVSALEGYTGPTTAEAGGVLTIGSYTFTCGADSSCSVTVAPDGSHFTTTGTITVMKMAEPEPEPDTTTPTSTDVDANMALAMAIDAADDPTAITTDADTVLNMDTAVALVSNGKPAATSMLAMSDRVIADLDNGWSGSAHEKTTEAEGMTPASHDFVAIYNNKGADEQVGFEAYYEGLATSRAVDDSTGAIEVALATDTVMLEGVSTDTTVDTDGVEGTFHGLEGKFVCSSATDCTISLLADGSYRNTGTGTLTFTPNLPAGTESAADKVDALMVTVDDQDYMHFGYWVQTSTDADGDPTATVNAFFGGTMMTPTADYQALEGQASYAGPASGLYVLKTFDAQGAGTPASAGQFTAMADLTATFGTPTSVGSVNHNMISGTITSFMANGEAIPGGWSLDLQNANIASGGPDATTNRFSGMTQETDNMDGAMGAWRGLFFGEVTNNTAPVADVFPSGVAGQFTGHFTNGHVIGGFGAERQDSN